MQAKHGGRGDNKDCTGKNAQHVVIPVPLGKYVYIILALVCDSVQVELKKK